MPSDSEQIPITEDRLEQLNGLKEDGQTYDELLGELVETYNRHQLAEMVREKQESGTFVKADTSKW